MAKVIDFLTRLYRRRSHSSDAAYSLGWSAALRYRTDERLSDYRNYLLDQFKIDEEDLDAMFAAEAIKTEIGVHENAPVQEMLVIPLHELLKLGDRYRVKKEFIQLASHYEPAANLLSAHIKLLEMHSEQSMDEHNEDTYNGDNLRKTELLINQSIAKQKEYTPSSAFILEIIKMPKLQRGNVYKTDDVDKSHQLFIEGLLIALSSGDGIEELIDMYDSFYDGLSNNFDSVVDRYALLAAFLKGLDSIKSSSSSNEIDASPLLVWLYRDNDPTIVSLATDALLARSVSLDQVHNDQFVMEKMLISLLQKQVFWNNGAIFGAMLTNADRRLTNMFYGLMDLLDLEGLKNSLYILEGTRSAAAIDFLIDWTIHLGNCNKKQEAGLTTKTLIKLSERLKSQSVLEGTFRIKNAWSRSIEHDAFVEVPFTEYAARLLPKLNDFARQYRS